MVARMAGYDVRFADVARDALMPEADAWTRLMTGDPGIIVATHLFGHALPREIFEAARARGWIVIEEVRLAEGAAREFGDAAYFSLDAPEEPGALGGGAIALDDAAWAARLRDRMRSVKRASNGRAALAFARQLWRTCLTIPVFYWWSMYPVRRITATAPVDPWSMSAGRAERYYALVPRLYFERAPNDAMARVGLSRLRGAAMRALRRRVNAAHLRELLAEDGVGVPLPASDGAAPMFVPIVVDDPRAVAAGLIARGVDAWPEPLACVPDLPRFQNGGNAENARALALRLLALPTHHALGPVEMGHIARALRAVLRETKNQ
ncbi:MAG: hypothetical protein M5R36_24840 [Deltaproteobacteria bacterium]|nr:hypothetical protein [Deltaproteobacteria bacterium]